MITAMATPFDENGAVDEAAALKLATHLLEHGSHGLVISGSTGEAPTLTDEEALVLVRAIRKEVGEEALLICGTGTNYTEHSIELTEGAAEAGADAALIVTPYYNKPNPAGILAHFEAIAAAVPDLPLIAYNIPSRVVVNVPPEQLAELAKIDNVVAVKQANNDELQPIEGMDDPRRQRRHLPQDAGNRRRRRHPASPRTWSARRCAKSGTRPRPETSSGRARSTPGLRPALRRDGRDHQPDPGQGGAGDDWA